MKAAIVQVIGAACVATLAGAAERSDRRLEVVTAGAPEVRAGEAISLRVIYANLGKEPFFLYRGLDLGGDEGLSITARQNGCTVEVERAFIESPVEWKEFLLVPLVPTRGLVEELRLNDLNGLFIGLPLLKTGRYELSARLRVTSRGRHEAWSGVAQSAPAVLMVQPPAAESVARWVGVLEKCAAGDCGGMESATNFFSVVRDGRAADLLARLAGSGGGVMHALAAQGRRTDVPALRAYAKAHTIPAARAYYLDAAERIEQGDPCR